MIEGLIKQFMGSSQGSSVMSELSKEGLSPDKAQEAVQATAEGALKHGGAAGIDLSNLLGGSGGVMGSVAGALGGMGKGASLTGGTVAKLTGPVTQFLEDKGFPHGVAQKVVNVVLPRLMEMAQKH